MLTAQLHVQRAHIYVCICCGMMCVRGIIIVRMKPRLVHPALVWADERRDGLTAEMMRDDVYSGKEKAFINKESSVQCDQAQKKSPEKVYIWQRSPVLRRALALFGDGDGSGVWTPKHLKYLVLWTFEHFPQMWATLELINTVIMSEI